MVLLSPCALRLQPIFARLTAVCRSIAGVLPADERAVGNMHQRNDLLIFSDVLMNLPRMVFNIIYRQPLAAHQRIMRDGMFGHPSSVLIDFLKKACEREKELSALATLMPSTSLHENDRMLGTELTGVWCSHEQRMCAHPPMRHC